MLKIHAVSYFHTRWRVFVLLHTLFRTFTHGGVEIPLSYQWLEEDFRGVTLNLTHI